MKPTLLLLIAALATSCAPTKVERHSWVTGLKREAAPKYRKLHTAAWPGVLANLKTCNVRNYSIYEREIGGKIYLFSYLEYTGSNFDADMKKMGDDAETQRWWKETAPCQEPLPGAPRTVSTWADAKEIFHMD